MFIDEVTIEFRAGDGGDGCISFRREKFVAKGGPDGGDGGDGGDVVLSVDPHMRTLLWFRHQRVFRAGNGQPGQGKQMSGKQGADAELRVPVGTVVEDAETGRILADLITGGDRMVIARGGRGGKGNVHFKSATRRVPRIATPGTEGAQARVKLTLKLLADVGLVGLPNAGKSTLMKRISNATPKVGAFPFTTIRPNLGIVGLDDYRALVLADLPGLIAGAHLGKGLGLQFLRHVERTRILLVLIDAASPHPEEDLRVLLHELHSFQPRLLRRPRLVCYSRSDLMVGRDLPPLDGEMPLRISAHSGLGIRELLFRLDRMFADVEAQDSEAVTGERVDSDSDSDSDLEPEPEESSGLDTESDRERSSAGSEPESESRRDEMSVEAAAKLVRTDMSDRAPIGETTHRPAFAERVDAGRPGDPPWPTEYYVEVPDDRAS